MMMQFLKYGLIGALNSGIGFGIIVAAMYFFDADPLVANLGGYLVGGSVSFVLNGRVTFGQDSLSSGMFVRFAAVTLLAYLANLAAVWVCLPYNRYLAQLLGMAVYVVVGFLGCRLFAFRAPVPRRPRSDGAHAGNP